MLQGDKEIGKQLRATANCSWGACNWDHVLHFPHVQMSSLPIRVLYLLAISIAYLIKEKIIWHSFILRLLKVTLPWGLRRSWKVKDKWHVQYQVLPVPPAHTHPPSPLKNKKRSSTPLHDEYWDSKPRKWASELPVLQQLLPRQRNDSASYSINWWLNRAVNCWNSIYFNGSHLTQWWFTPVSILPSHTGFVFYFYWT